MCPLSLVWPKRARRVGWECIKAGFLDAGLRGPDPKQKHLAHCLRGSGVRRGWETVSTDLGNSKRLRHGAPI